MVDVSLAPPGSLGLDRVAPVYVDGVEVGAFAAAVANNGFQAGQRVDQGARFWSTPPRLAEASPVRDVFEVDLSGPRLVNKISFDLAHFPQDAVVEYSVDNSAPWQPVVGLDNLPLIRHVPDSNPPIVQAVASQSNGHPQHFGAGHWLHIQEKVQAISAARLRIILTRPLGAIYPTNSQGLIVPYSLGIRSFLVGYEVLGREDVPVEELRPGSITEHRSFAGTRDLLGSSISYAERENPAVNLLSGGVWRSEPQPISNAVIPLYVNVSNPDGSPTVIERLFLEPLLSGVSMNLYTTAERLAEGQSVESIKWVPINRDFILRRGYVRFDPVAATILKLEFTNLAPEPYDAPAPIVRTVRLFPSELQPRVYTLSSGNDGGIGTLVQSQLSTLLRYDDNNRPVIEGLTDTSVGYTPTEVFYSTDPNAAERLRNLSGFFNYLAWQGGYSAPRWPSTQQHVYVETEVLHNQRVAFYVGLAALQVFRLDYAFTEDTNAYLEYFFDTEHIEDIRGWVQTTTDFKSGPDVSVATSKALISRTGVKGIQFATTQSPSLQLLPDSDFDSGTLGQTALDANWATFGENEAPAVLVPNNEYNTDIGTTVTVTRDGTLESNPTDQTPHTWASIGIRYRTYLGIAKTGLTWGDLNTPGASTGPQRVGGIFNRNVIAPSLGSRLFGAARVISKIALQEPLYLQILNVAVNPPVVVAEAPAFVPANQIVEWEVPYEASGTSSDLRTWDQVGALGSYSDLATRTWDQVASATGYVPVRLIVRLAQKNNPNASWSVDTLSLFEEAIRWEFSNDDGQHWFAAPGIRNNPNGVLTFPEPLRAPEYTYEAIEGRNDTAPTPWEDLTTGSWADLEGKGRLKPPPVRNLLRWRVICAEPDQHVSALSIRPWYDFIGHGVPSVEGVNVPGANLALYDQYQPIALDPRWRMWNKPIPLSWFYFFRQFVLAGHDTTVTYTKAAQNTFLGDAFIDTPGSGTFPLSNLSESLVLPYKASNNPPGTIETNG